MKKSYIEYLMNLQDLNQDLDFHKTLLKVISKKNNILSITIKTKAKEDLVFGKINEFYLNPKSANSYIIKACHKHIDFLDRELKKLNEKYPDFAEKYSQNG